MEGKILELVNSREFQSLATLKLLMRLIATKDMGRYIFNSDVYAKVIAGNYKVEVLDGVEVEKCVKLLCLRYTGKF